MGEIGTWCHPVIKSDAPFVSLWIWRRCCIQSVIMALLFHLCPWRVAAQPGRGRSGLIPSLSKAHLETGQYKNRLCLEAAQYNSPVPLDLLAAKKERKKKRRAYGHRGFTSRWAVIHMTLTMSCFSVYPPLARDDVHKHMCYAISIVKLTIDWPTFMFRYRQAWQHSLTCVVFDPAIVQFLPLAWLRRRQLVGEVLDLALYASNSHNPPHQCGLQFAPAVANAEHCQIKGSKRDEVSLPWQWHDLCPCFDFAVPKFTTYGTCCDG